MDPISIRLNSDELEQIDKEAEKQGFSNRAEYLRWIIRNRPSVEKDTAESLSDEINELRKRVEQLEAREK